MITVHDVYSFDPNAVVSWEPFVNIVGRNFRQPDTTWFSGPIEEFISHTRRGFERGAIVAHFLGGTAVELRGARAIAQTKNSAGTEGANATLSE